MNNMFENCSTEKEVIQEYIKEAMKTANKEAIEDSERYFKIFIFGELGELAGLVKKEHYHKMNISKDTYIDEIGDILWGFAFGFTYCGNLTNWDIMDLSDEYDTSYDLGHMVEHLSEHVIDNTILHLMGFMKYMNIDYKDVMIKNIEKLRKRYPNGYSHKSCEERIDYICHQKQKTEVIR